MSADTTSNLRSMLETWLREQWLRIPAVPKSQPGSYDRGYNNGMGDILRGVQAILDDCLPDETTALQIDEGKLWSFLRDVLSHGMAIEKDLQAGAYPSYEHFSAHIDDVARKRAEELGERCCAVKASGDVP